MMFRVRGARAGATALEFAFVAPVIFALVFGIIELGRALMVTHILSEVSRDSARYAVVTVGANQTTSDIQSYATSRLTAYGISTLMTPVVSVSDSSSTDLSASTGPAQKAGSANFGKYSNGSEVTVKVQVNFSEVTWLPFADYVASGAVLSGQYTLRRDPM
jgi:Flp pilus assembly protein TadG